VGGRTLEADEHNALVNAARNGTRQSHPAQRPRVSHANVTLDSRWVVVTGHGDTVMMAAVLADASPDWVKN
jgi:hypothetical protein